MLMNDSSCAPAHNTPLPLKRSPPASFKRLLDRVVNDLSDAFILEPHRINDIICLLLPVRTKHLVCRESCSGKPSTRCRPLPCINHHKRRTLLRTPEAEGYRHSIVMAGPYSPFPEDEIEVRSVARNLTELPLNEVRCETAPAFMDVSPHRAAGATATFTRAKVLLAARLYNETRRTHKQVTRSNGSRLSCGRLARLRKAVGRTVAARQGTTLRFP